MSDSPHARLRALKVALDAALAHPAGSAARAEGMAQYHALREQLFGAQRTTRDPADYKLAQAGEKDE